MPNDADIKSTLEEIRSTYSVCDVCRLLHTITSIAECSDIRQQVSDALINLHVPAAGFLRDIGTIQQDLHQAVIF